MPEGVGDGGKNVVVGVGDGTIRIVKLGPNKVTTELRHDEVEGVVGLGFDVEGRLISGGGSIIKVWQEKMNLEEEVEDDDSDDDEAGPKKRAMDGSDDDSDADSSEEEDRGRKSRKKRRKANRNKNVGNGIIGLKGLE